MTVQQINTALTAIRHRRSGHAQHARYPRSSQQLITGGRTSARRAVGRYLQQRQGPRPAGRRLVAAWLRLPGVPTKYRRGSAWLGQLCRRGGPYLGHRTLHQHLYGFDKPGAPDRSRGLERARGGGRERAVDPVEGFEFDQSRIPAGRCSGGFLHLGGLSKKIPARFIHISTGITEIEIHGSYDEQKLGIKCPQSMMCKSPDLCDDSAHSHAITVLLCVEPAMRQTQELKRPH